MSNTTVNLEIGKFFSTQFGNPGDSNGCHTGPAKIISVKDGLVGKAFMVRMGNRVGLATEAPEHIDAVLYCTNTFLINESAQDWVSIKTVADAAKYWGFM